MFNSWTSVLWQAIVFYKGPYFLTLEFIDVGWAEVLLRLQKACCGSSVCLSFPLKITPGSWTKAMAEAFNHPNIIRALDPTLRTAGVLGLDIVRILTTCHLCIWIYRKATSHEASSLSQLRVNAL